jgi:hypothetical protein
MLRCDIVRTLNSAAVTKTYADRHVFSVRCRLKMSLSLNQQVTGGSEARLMATPRPIGGGRAGLGQRRRRRG